MTFAKRLRFFGFGLLLGVLLSMILFGPEKFSCSGYLPEGRVLAELQTKKFKNDSLINAQLQNINLEGDQFKKEVLPDASINFKESNAQLKPCPMYSVYYPKDSSKYNFTIYKCDSTAYISQIKDLK